MGSSGDPPPRLDRCGVYFWWWVRNVVKARTPCGAKSTDQRRTFGVETQVQATICLTARVATLLTHHPISRQWTKHGNCRTPARFRGLRPAKRVAHAQDRVDASNVRVHMPP